MEWKIVALCGKSVVANCIVGMLLPEGRLYRLYKIFVKNRKANPQTHILKCMQCADITVVTGCADKFPKDPCLCKYQNKHKIPSLYEQQTRHKNQSFSIHQPTYKLNCLKNNFEIYIKIYTKTAPTCFGAITIIRERIIRAC
jgi:hypothetical protein